MFDTIIRNGRIVTAAEILPPGLDLGIKDGKIAYIGLPLGSDGDAQIFDAQGAYITPGGIDSHVHIQQGNHAAGDSWETGSRSAIAGGNTTVLAFASQERHEDSIFPVVEEYHRRATGNAYCDYGFHVILTNPTREILDKELPHLVEEGGITSVKLYMTYDPLKLNDGELLDIMMTTKGLGMTTMVHAENHDMVAMIIKRLDERGLGDPFYHAIARPQIAETEATYRAISLSELVDSPLLIVHMSSREAVKHVRKAQTRQLPIYAEACPHYLLLKSDRLQAPDFEGSKWICSPPLRHDESDLEAMWESLANGTFTVLSSDHCPDAFDHPCGKKAGLIDGKPHFTKVPNGLPGIETRLPLLFNVSGPAHTDRISLPKFVELTSTNPAKLYGLDKRKGSLLPGLDADIVVWYPKDIEGGVEITNDILHHEVDYTPFHGFKVRNWPKHVFLRGKLVWDREDGGLKGSKADGNFIKRGKPMFQMRKMVTDAPGMARGERKIWA